MFRRDMEARSFQFFAVKCLQKSETLALKKLYQLQKIGYFRKRVFKKSWASQVPRHIIFSWCSLVGKKVEQE